MPAYSIGEAVVWFRFPLFAMAVVFWLGRDRRLVYMLLSIGCGMVIMSGILAAEMMIVGRRGERLSWPYGDLVPGNYLKACLPAFLVVCYALSVNRQLASFSALIALASIIASIMSGERINFLIRACGGLLAAVAWKPKLGRVLALVAIEGVAVVMA